MGEVIALRRSDIDLENCTVRVREQLTELDGGQMVFGPPKSRAGKRVVTFPATIVSALRAHLGEFVEDRPDAFVFLGAGGGFMRGGNFRRAASWNRALFDLGIDDLHFHDLRHTGNTLAARTGASMADLKARMGQDSDRAASIYHHASEDADQEIAAGLDARLRAERPWDDDDDGTAGALVPVA